MRPRAYALGSSLTPLKHPPLHTLHGARSHQRKHERPTPTSPQQPATACHASRRRKRERCERCALVSMHLYPRPQTALRLTPSGGIRSPRTFSVDADMLVDSKPRRVSWLVLWTNVEEEGKADNQVREEEHRAFEPVGLACRTRRAPREAAQQRWPRIGSRRTSGTVGLGETRKALGARAHRFGW